MREIVQARRRVHALAIRHFTVETGIHRRRA